MNDNHDAALKQLKDFLNKLFQFESQDLDFGVYKILRYKRIEISQFIDELLGETIDNQLNTLTKTQTTKIEERCDDLKKEDLVKGWIEGDEEMKKILKKLDNNERIKEYQELQQQLSSIKASIESVNIIYNCLTEFFSRYYDKGDFISKRRFGNKDKYMLPYKGEETFFHWANQDQYYIKSSETFQKFAFKVPHASGELVVNFKLTQIQSEQGNVKADENKYFVLADKEPEFTQYTEGGQIAHSPKSGNQEELNIFFEFRPLNETEKKSVNGNGKQDALDEQAAATIQDKIKKHAIAVNLWKTNDKGQTFLLQKLHHYTRKNKYDFFIHKDLKGFFQRELDFYIKSELINVDDLYVSETDIHLEHIRINLKTIKVFKNVADTIIEFLAQIEDFQKKLWEKKKFVLATHWIITLDRLIHYIGEDAAKPILESVIKNPNQLAEWQKDFGNAVLPHWDNLTVNDLIVLPKTKTNPELGFSENVKTVWRKLPIDTVHFSLDFKELLLTVLSQSIDLEDKADGLVIHSDNYHGVRVLENKFAEKIKSIYIDPPYNTNASEIIYKNSFKHSSWITLMNDRLEISKTLLNNNGLMCCTIDDFEHTNLAFLIEKTFSELLGTVTIRIKPSGRPIPSGFAVSHEYALFATKNDKVAINRFQRDEEQLARYKETDFNGAYFWEMLRKAGSNSTRYDRPTMYFPLYVNPNNSVTVPKMEYNKDKQFYQNIEPTTATQIIVYPIKDNSIEGRWYLGYEQIKSISDDLKAIKQKDGSYLIYYKRRPNKGTQPTTVWIDAKYSATEHGTALLKKLFSEHEVFSYPKSIYAVIDCLNLSSLEEDDFVLDYFAGSGTTFHATQLLNQEDDGTRKCILIEQGDYFYTVILPRIKKIAYTFDWKEGKPKDDSMNGLGVFVKYQRLEQYEESLENIAFSASEETIQKALEFEHYMPKYFLTMETRDSQTLVNTEAMQNPWAYQLKVWNGFTYDTEQAVDLVETFNYLIGLHVQKYITKTLNGRKYQFVVGKNNGDKKIVVVWRDTTGWGVGDYELDREVLKDVLQDFVYDVLYINGQAHISGYQPIEEVFKNKMIP